MPRRTTPTSPPNSLPEAYREGPVSNGGSLCLGGRRVRFRIRTGAPSRARGRGGVPPLSLVNGRRQGAYWLVGDVRNTPGRSMFVRLKETARGPAGKWTDAASGEHGDLLDVIREMPRPRRFQGCRRRSALISQPAASGAGADATRHRRPSPTPRQDRPRRRADCSPCRSRSNALPWKRICADAALRLCTEPAVCASTRAATTGPTSTARPRHGLP